MTARFRILVTPKLRRQLAGLEQAATSRPGSLRDRELRAVRLGLRALAEGREEDFDGKRLGFSPSHHDLRDCAELKIPVVRESRYGSDLGPSPRLIYREFESEGGGLPYREAVCFEPRHADRPFEVAGSRLRREVGRPCPALAHLPNRRPAFGRGAPSRLVLRDCRFRPTSGRPSPRPLTSRPLLEPSAAAHRSGRHATRQHPVAQPAAKSD